MKKPGSVSWTVATVTELYEEEMKESGSAHYAQADVTQVSPTVGHGRKQGTT